LRFVTAPGLGDRCASAGSRHGTFQLRRDWIGGQAEPLTIASTDQVSACFGSPGVPVSRASQAWSCCRPPLNRCGRLVVSPDL